MLDDIPKFEDTEEIIDAPVFEETESVQEEISTIDSIIAGATSGLPALAQAAGDVIGEIGATVGLGALTGSISTSAAIDIASESFNAKKQAIEEEKDAAREANPVAFHTADFVSGAVTPGIGAISKLGKAGKLLAGTGIGAVQGLARSDAPFSKEGVIDTLVGGTAGLGFGVGAVGLSAAKPAFKKVGSAISKKGGEVTSEFLTKIGKTSLSKKLNLHLKRTKETMGQFGTKMLEETDTSGKRIFRSGRSKQQIFEDLEESAEGLGEQYARVLQKADTFPESSVSAQDLYSRFRERLIGKLETSDADEFKVASKVFDDKLKRTFGANIEIDKNTGKELLTFESSNKWSPSRVQRFANDYSQIVKNFFKRPDGGTSIESARMNADLASEARKVVEEQLEVFTTGDKKFGELIAPAFKNIKARYGRIITSKEMIGDRLLKEIDGPLGSLKSGLSLQGFLPAAILASGSGNPRTMAFAVGATINNVLSGGKTQTALANGLKNVGDFVQRNPDTDLVNRLFVAANGSGIRFREVISSAIGEVDLISNPLERTSESARERQNSVIAVAARIDINLGKSVRDVFKNGSDEDISAMMDNLSKQPEAKQFFEEGQGWNGTLHTPEDKQAAENQLETGNMSYAQRLFHKAALKKDGTIPQPQQEDQPFLIWQSNRGEKPKI